MLPSVLDPWAAHSLYEAAHLAKNVDGSKVWLVSLGTKAKLQQLMMQIAQKVPFQLVVRDASASGFVDSHAVAAALAEAVGSIAELDRSRLLLFGGCASASRDAGTTLQLVGEHLGIVDQFLSVDRLEVQDGGAMRVLERIEGGRYQVSECSGPPAVLGWATGNLPEPPNNPQIGMANMRGIMPALGQAKPADLSQGGLHYHEVKLPEQRRETRIVKDVPAEEIARELADWIKR
jgi:electron transfer flavoprotein beta subunit